MEIKSKCWIEVNGEPVFGEGRKRLFKAIEEHGSINRAAKAVAVSYRRAWSHIDAMERRLGMKLVERKTGGRYGGGAVLTQEAREFVARFELLEAGMSEYVNARFDKIFRSRRDGPGANTGGRYV